MALVDEDAVADWVCVGARVRVLSWLPELVELGVPVVLLLSVPVAEAECDWLDVGDWLGLPDVLDVLD